MFTDNLVYGNSPRDIIEMDNYNASHLEASMYQVPVSATWSDGTVGSARHQNEQQINHETGSTYTSVSKMHEYATLDPNGTMVIIKFSCLI